MKDLFVCLSFLAAISAAQTAPPAKPALKAALAPAAQEKPFVPSTDDLLTDVQQSIKGEGRVGMVWWIPFEFWEASDKDGKTVEALKALKEYTLVAVVTGRVGSIGNIIYEPLDKVRASTFIRDKKGTEYPPLAKVSEEAELLTQMIQPIFVNALGKMGENIQLIYFPAKDKDGQRIDDPRSTGDFTVVLKNGVAGADVRAFDFRLPLNSMVPPRYCPKGKERVQANWLYCPWHGVALQPETAKSAK